MVINSGPHFGFGIIGMIIPLLVISVFIIVFLLIVITLFKSAGTSIRNIGSPVLSVNAHVVSKRGLMRNHHTWYYVTFQVESGDRMEFGMDGREYGLLAEGDTGKLTFQGTRYMGFERFGNNAMSGVN